MGTTLTAIFDGNVLRPEGHVDLKPNTRYRVTVEQEPRLSEEGEAWDILEELTGTFDGPQDWAVEHDYYLYSTPKRSKGTEH